MDNDIISYALYIFLNFFVYSLVIIFQVLFIYQFPLYFHIIQLLLSFVCIYLLKKVKEKNSYITSSHSRENNEVKLSENEPIIKSNLMLNIGCDICKIDKIPLRSHHCDICNKCVKCFDHHCWILGGCIGENNKLIFLIFLFFQNCSLNWSIISLFILLKKRMNENISYLLTFYFSLTCLFSIIFLFIFLYHCYLFITNQTNFELFNEDQCPYIAIYSSKKNKFLKKKKINNNNNYNIRYRPFDIGLKKNFLLFFELLKNNNKEKRGINWEKIFYENLKNIRTNSGRTFCDKKSKKLKRFI